MPVNFIDIQQEYQKNKQLNQKDIEIFLKWTQNEKNIPKITELQAILFLQSCYYDLEAAKKALEIYFQQKIANPSMFGMQNPITSNILDAFLVVRLSRETSQGYTIFFLKLIDTNPKVFVAINIYHLFNTIAMCHLYQKGTSNGHIIIVDLEGVTWSHFFKIGPFDMKKQLYFLQEALPVRLKGIHMVNCGSIIDRLMALIKPFLKKDLLEAFHIHKNIQELWNYIPGEFLPADYGGNEPEIRTLHANTRKSLNASQELFEWAEKQTADQIHEKDTKSGLMSMFSRR